MGAFRGISIQSNLIQEVEDAVKEIGTYRSVAEFVSEAIRLRLEQLTKERKLEASL